MSACKRGCCWTPYGHSTAAVDCTCHEAEQKPDRLRALLAEVEGDEP